MLEALRLFFHSSEPWVAIAISLGAMAASFALLVVAILSFPADYFAEEKRPTSAHPAIRLLLAIARNMLGLLFVALGVILSVPGVPGQGILTICVGLLMLDLPKKRALERRLLRNDKLRRFINAIRAKFNRPPLR